LLVVLWVALGLSVVFTVAALAFAAGRGLGAWRVFTRSRDRLSSGLEDMDRRVAAMEERMARVDESTARLEHAQADLKESIAAARSIADAAAEVRRAVRLALRLIPT
jgi:chromosome segregation ATPase